MVEMTLRLYSYSLSQMEMMWPIGQKALLETLSN